MVPNDILEIRMTSDLERDLTALIGKCECAIRRSDVSHQETLHMLQQQLVTARDARFQSDTEAALHKVFEYYYQHIPATERTTTFAALTEQIEQLKSKIETADSEEQPQTVSSHSE